MKPSGLRLACVVASLSLLAGPIRAGQPSGQEGGAGELVGSWKMVSAKFGGQESDLPRQLTVLKHVTPTHFTWVRVDPETGEVAAIGGGPYTLEGDAYTEILEYGFGFGESFEEYRGKPQSFTRKIEGDTWHHVGKLSTGLEIEEVWERIEKAKE